MARLKALRKDVFKPAVKLWGDEAARIARNDLSSDSMPYSKGVLVKSIRRKSATQYKGVVVGWYHGYFVDAGVKPHSLRSRKSRPKSGLGRTIFAATARKGHPGYPARPWRGAATAGALRKYPVLDIVIEAWNKAA